MGRREEAAREGVGRREAPQGRRNATQRRADSKADGNSAEFGGRCGEAATRGEEQRRKRNV